MIKILEKMLVDYNDGFHDEEWIKNGEKSNQDMGRNIPGYVVVVLNQ